MNTATLVKTVIIAMLLAVVSTPLLAQVPESSVPLYYVPSTPARVEGMLREQPRADGPGLQFAIKLAVAAVEACKAKGGKVSVLVADSVGTPVVLLSGDGAGERSQLITITKAHTVVKYRMPSGDVAQKARTDTKLAKELAQNPNIGVARGGAFPLMSGGELIGVLAVSGYTGEDDNCAKEAMAKVPMR
jgi:uncharacterized protein GlcG (DUF336 family)